MLGLRARDVLKQDLSYRTGSGALPTRVWFWFRHWRRTRPFWAGLLAMFGGFVIFTLPLAPLPIMNHEGIAGVSGGLFGALIMAMGLFLWFLPAQRYFSGVITILLSLASFVTSNFGGFLIGMIFGIIGGSLAMAWAPLTAWGLDSAQPPSGGTGSATVTLPDQPAVIDLAAAERGLPTQSRRPSALENPA